MDKLRSLPKGAQVVVGASALLFIDSLFNWYEVKHTSYGESMWHGSGFVAGLFLIALLVWVGLRAANVTVAVGKVSNSMITGALSVLLLLFVLIRVLSKPGGGFSDAFVDRTVWTWIGLLLAVVVVAGAWLNMQAAGESLADVRAKMASMTAQSPSSGSSAPAAAPSPPSPEPPSAEPPPPAESPAAGETEHS